MRKILGIVAILALCAATARAAPTDWSATSLASLDAQGSLASEEGVAACGISIYFTNIAFFMGADENDGLLKGPRSSAMFFGREVAAPHTTKLAVIHFLPPDDPITGSCGITSVG